MSGPVTYRRDESIAVITMDDGKVNALGPSMQQALTEALDDADRDDVGAVVIAGNHRVFSGGFDLKVLTAGEVGPAIDMLRGGFELSYRLLSYPKPVVMACTGPAIAMGSFLLCSADHRIAAPGYTIQANEVAIGMVLPYAALAILKLRLTPSAYQQAVGLSKVFFGETALAAGFVDEIDLPDRVLGRAQEAALEFSKLNRGAHAASKLRARAAALTELRATIEAVPAECGVQ
ncbi:MAG TPA: crotonase/enoyl-CoA hydratase family protein [Mycobacterium sp.]|nr:crotonase/enoyl-CoA hydratase family protein [Mycobacterium sp.]